MATTSPPAKRQWTPAPKINDQLTDTPRAIAVRDDEQARILLIRQTYFKDLQPLEWEMLNAEAAARGLSVLRKEMAAIKFSDQLAIFPTIHGYRALAQKSGRLRGIESQWTADGRTWLDAWIYDDPPAAARCVVTTVDGGRFVGIATFKERKRTYFPWEGPEGNRRRAKDPVLMDQWRDQPAHMLAKCSEADALRKSGLITDLEPLAIDYDPFEAGGRGAFAAVQDERPDDWSGANRNAHRAAALGAGDPHELVRETLQAANPAIASVRDASALELNNAAEVLDAFGDLAPDAFDPDAEPEPDAEGNPFPGVREQWDIQVEDALAAAQTAQSLSDLRNAAGGELWKWLAIIRHKRLSEPLAVRYGELAKKQFGDLEAIDGALQSRRDARAVEATSLQAKAKERRAASEPPAVAQSAPEDAPAEQPRMFGPDDPDRFLDK